MLNQTTKSIYLNCITLQFINVLLFVQNIICQCAHKSLVLLKNLELLQFIVNLKNLMLKKVKFLIKIRYMNNIFI